MGEVMLRRVAYLLLLLLAVAVALTGVCVYRAVNTPDLQIQGDQPDLSLLDGFDYDAALERLGEAVRIRTVSYRSGEVPHPDNFFALHDMLARRYPLTHATLHKELIGKYSLLFYWEGTDKELMPYMLMSHLDVVPVENETLTRWSHEPFAGHIIDGYIYGRGTMDDKLGVCGILEAVEVMIKNGVRPKRSVYLGFGHDEEVNGNFGMSVMVKALKKRDVRLLFALDEGGLISMGSVPGVKDPVALVGVTEKGSVDFRLSVVTPGGHSSMPPVPETPIGILAKAVTELEANPMEPRMEGTLFLFEYLQAQVPFAFRLFVRNLWLFKPFLSPLLSGDGATNAAIRTTFAATMMRGSDKTNSIPAEPSINVNVRIIPGDSIASVEAAIKRTINDPRVVVTPVMSEANEASPISPVQCEQFDFIRRAIKSINPDVHVAPFVMVGGTDAKYLYDITDYVYRFAPFRADKEDLKRFHGINERLAVDDYKRAIQLYYTLLRRADAMEEGKQREWAEQQSRYDSEL
uniref:Peptidase M20 dimerisation domain-containing protein n=1 Tax=Palpitomonas bilix TaxID=652834 RepID=A0A7S3GBR6_9EUKA